MEEVTDDKEEIQSTRIDNEEIFIIVKEKEDWFETCEAIYHIVLVQDPSTSIYKVHHWTIVDDVQSMVLV